MRQLVLAAEVSEKFRTGSREKLELWLAAGVNARAGSGSSVERKSQESQQK
jgi:hypothetical protein